MQGLFEFDTTLTLPVVLAVGRSLTFPVSFVPRDSMGAEALLGIRSSTAKYARDINLTGTTSSALQHAAFGLSFFSGTQDTLLDPSSKMTIALLATNGMPARMSLRSIHVRFGYTEDVLTLSNYVCASGWVMASLRDTLGILDVELRSVIDQSQLPGAALLSFVAEGMITTVDSTSIELLSLVLNEADPKYETCTLGVDLAQAPLVIGINPVCGSTTLINALEHKPILSQLSVHPNPVSSTNASIELDFNLTTPSDVKVSMLNVLGEVVYREGVTSLTAGAETIQLPIVTCGEGAYFVLVEAGAERLMEKGAVLR
jgi:hypothetical protein